MSPLRPAPSSPAGSPPAASSRVSRREALRIGGVTVSLAALVAACGENRGGDGAPGRVGVADEPNVLTDLPINDVVLLRTASSLELTAVEVYERVEQLGVLGDDLLPLLDRLIANHRATADQMGELTATLGGTAWTETNPWLMERLIEPVFAVIADSDDVTRDVFDFAVALENLATATHQSLSSTLTDSAARTATVTAAAGEARHAAALVIAVRGAEGYVSSAVTGADAPREDGVVVPYAITSRFGSLAQIELVLGAPDENGNRATFLLATPAQNSFIYEEMS